MISPVYQTPMPSLIATSLFSVAAVYINKIDVMITSLGFAFALIFFMVVFGLLKLRWQQPDKERPIKVTFKKTNLLSYFLTFFYQHFR
jgi:amino acid transporter